MSVVELGVEFEPTDKPDFTRRQRRPGKLQLYINGELVDETDAPHSTPIFHELEGLKCGFDGAGPVLEGVPTPPFEFTGTLHSVTVDLSGELIRDHEAEMARIMSQQQGPSGAVVRRGQSGASFPASSDRRGGRSKSRFPLRPPSGPSPT